METKESDLGRMGADKKPGIHGERKRRCSCERVGTSRQDEATLVSPRNLVSRGHRGVLGCCLRAAILSSSRCNAYVTEVVLLTARRSGLLI